MIIQFHIISIAIMIVAQISQAQPNTSVFSWRVAGKLPPDQQGVSSPGVAGPVAGCHNGVLMIGGGANFPAGMPWEGGKKKYHQKLFIYKPVGKNFSPVEGIFELPELVAYAATCTTPSGVFYAGGENEKGISAKAYLLKWDKKKHDIAIAQLPDLPEGLVNAACTADGNHVFVAGGETRESVSARCWVIDLGAAKASWKELPALPRPVSHAVMVAMQSGKESHLYFLGGRRKIVNGVSELYQSVYHLDASRKEWTALPTLPYPVSAGTGVAAGESGIYLFGGDRGEVFSKVESCLVAISNEQRIKEKQELTDQKNRLLRTHPGFSKEILYYNVVTGTTDIAGQIPFSTPVTTTAFWFKGAVILPSGEIKAGVRSPNILKAKIPSRNK